MTNDSATRGLEGFDFVVLLRGELAGFGQGDRAEADFVAGFELADFPEVGADDRGGADEAAAARAVGAEDDRHVAGEIDRADGVGVVVDVGRVEAGFAAVAARPLRFRADETDAGARGVVVDFVGRRKKRGDVGVGEEIGGAVGAVEDGERPLAREVWD
jgi:hypothetical protein